MHPRQHGAESAQGPPTLAQRTDWLIAHASRRAGNACAREGKPVCGPRCGAVVLQEKHARDQSAPPLPCDVRGVHVLVRCPVVKLVAVRRALSSIRPALRLAQWNTSGKPCSVRSPPCLASRLLQRDRALTNSRTGYRRQIDGRLFIYALRRERLFIASV